MSSEEHERSHLATLNTRLESYVVRNSGMAARVAALETEVVSTKRSVAGALEPRTGRSRRPTGWLMTSGVARLRRVQRCARRRLSRRRLSGARWTRASHSLARGWAS